MNFHTIISTQDLQENLGNENWFIFDCRYQLNDPGAGLDKFRQGHVPGAQHVDMDRDLSSPMTETSGRHPLPDAGHFIENLRAWGLGNDSQVVCYDDLSGAFAARMWWMLNWIGHENVAVLDGGIKKWVAEERPLETETRDRPRGSFTGEADPGMCVDIGFVQHSLEQETISLLDARSSERFTARDQKSDPVPGHVPGATSYPFAGNLGQDKVFLPASELMQRYESMFSERPPEQIINMCGSGVTACHNILATRIAGLPWTRLYVGSWSEWLKDPARPVATGD
ncbi:MAG: sulfurtransferase [Gammaproteobacteria bacterium]|nr:sulfurtransferase [Gammaproteobacteria bacterium]